VAYRTYNALKSAPAEFQELRLEVLSLNTTLQALADESSSPTSIILLAPPQRQESLRVLLENCTKGLKQLDLLLGKYPSLGPNEKTRFLEHIRFASKGKQGPRDKLAIHTASINIFLTSLTHSSLGRLELLIKNVLRGGEKGALSALNSAQESDAWNSIGQDLALEGITSDVAVKFKHEIEAYTRHLANGGEPFWMKSRSNAPQFHSAPPSQSATLPQGAPPRYEAHQPMRPPSSAPPTPQQRPSGPYGSTPQNQGYSFGQAPATQHASHGATLAPQTTQNDSQQQPVPGAFGSPAMPQQPPQSATGMGFGLPASSSGKPSFSSNTPGYQAESPSNQASSGVDQQPQGFGGFGGQPSVNTGPTTGAFGSGGQHQPAGGGFNAKKPEQKPGGFFGSTAPATGSGLFGPPAQQQQQSGGLFGSKPATTGPASSLFGGSTQTQQGDNAVGVLDGSYKSSQPAPNQTSSGFSGQPAAAPGSNAVGQQHLTNSGEGLFGNQPSISTGSPFGNTGPSGPAFGNPAGYGFGQTSSSLFGGLGVTQVDNKQIDELAELFDHIFDIDEDVAAMAQGARRTSYLVNPPAPTPISDLRYVPPVYSPTVYSPPPAPLPTPITPQHIYQRIEETRSPNSGQIETSIVANTNTIINTNLLHTVRLQLEQVVIQYRDAQRAGDSRSVDHLLQNAIKDRVQYLRNAGAILIQCDLCHAPITDGYYHCDICANGDWDCCPQCLEQGKGCLGGHGLGRRNKDWIGEKHWMRC
jgi:hypothetical protein